MVNKFETAKFWMAIAAFIFQGVGTVFYMGSQTQFLKDELSVMRRDLGKLETNQTLLLQVMRDVAVLQSRGIEFEKRLDKIDRR